MSFERRLQRKAKAAKAKERQRQWRWSRDHTPQEVAERGATQITNDPPPRTVASSWRENPDFEGLRPSGET